MGGTRVATTGVLVAVGGSGVEVAVGGTLIAVGVKVGVIGGGTMSTVVKTYAPELAACTITSALDSVAQRGSVG